VDSTSGVDEASTDKPLTSAGRGVVLLIANHVLTNPGLQPHDRSKQV
jgi:hypothetical protein